jgi:hypothetical protein
MDLCLVNSLFFGNLKKDSLNGLYRLLKNKPSTMKKLLYILLVVLVASACSSPKYTASFNNYDKYVSNQPAVKSEVVVDEPVTEPATIAQSVSEPVTIAQPEPLLASTSSAPVELKAAPKEEVRKTYIQMTKTERKALRTHLKSEIKSYVKQQKKNLGLESNKSTGAWDNDLKMAAIFGIVGIVFTSLWGTSEILGVIGVIAVVVALVFLIKWLVRQ